MQVLKCLQIFLTPFLAFSFALAATADVIYLKNGRKIVARITREDSKEVFYEVEGGEFGVPKTLVEKVEKSPTSESPAPNPGVGAEGHHRLPPLDLPLPGEPQADARPRESPEAVKRDAVDEAELVKLEDAAARDPTVQNRHRLAEGYRQAAHLSTRRGEPEKAIEFYRRGLELAPNDLSLTLALAYQLIRQERDREAIEVLIPAETEFPKSPDIPVLLGSAYYGIEELERAIEEWQRALALGENPKLQQALRQAERERDLAGDYLEMRSPHFALRFEGRGSSELARQSLATLEGAFAELERDLDVYPQETIVVLLYPEETFRDITRSPSWTGALNDGKIRVPVSGLTSMTYDLARTLKHELTHSFVRQATRQPTGCPVWFNEGLAELEEGATTATLGAALARNYAELPSFAALEKPFTNLPPSAVPLAYAKSLAALEYLRDTDGQIEIQRLLKLMARQPDFSALLQSQLRMSARDFDQAVGAYLARRYGM
jgi:tetratricopeptide (TPR) repeat protein